MSFDIIVSNFVYASVVLCKENTREIQLINMFEPIVISGLKYTA